MANLACPLWGMRQGSTISPLCFLVHEATVRELSSLIESEENFQHLMLQNPPS